MCAVDMTIYVIGLCIHMPFTKVQHMQEVVSIVSGNLVGRKVMLLVRRISVLEDTIHCMSKNSFSPASGITVNDVVYMHVCAVHVVVYV